MAANCRWLKLDEWGGLAMDDPATCEHQLQSTLIAPLAATDRYVAFNSRPQDRASECARIAAWLAANGPIDVCVLGLGRNGHLGFNEPDDALTPHAHIAELAESSMTHAMLKQSKISLLRKHSKSSAHRLFSRAKRTFGDFSKSVYKRLKKTGVRCKYTSSSRDR